MDNQDRNYTTSRNNPYQETDYTKQDDSLQDAVKQNANKSQDEEVIKYKRSKKAYSRVIFAVESDAHLGGQGFDANREKLARNTVLSCWNTIYGIGGDYFDNANQISSTNIFGNRVTPSNAIKVANLYFNEVEDKVSFVMGGNHDAFWGNRNKPSNIAPGEMLAQNIGADYVPFALVYSIPLLVPKTHEVKYMTGIIIHSNLKANKFSVTDAGLRYILKKCADIGINIDFIVTEHLHTGSEGIYSVQMPAFEKSGKQIGYENKYVYVCNGKSFQNSNTTFGGENFFSNKTNLKALFCGWQENPYHTENQILEPKYIPNITPFNVLDKNEDKPGIFMSKLLHLYKRPSLEYYKKSLDNASLTLASMRLAALTKSRNEKVKEYLSNRKKAITDANKSSIEKQDVPEKVEEETK